MAKLHVRSLIRALSGTLYWAVCLVFASSIAGAQAPLNVATRIVPPFVMRGKTGLTGFSIELWARLTERMGLKSTFVVKPSVVELLAAIRSRQADVGIAAISITADRDKEFDFSQPMFEGGLQIMVANESESTSAITRITDQILSSGLLRWFGYIFVFGLVPAHIVWIFERRHNKGLLSHRSYWPGIFEAYWWSLACLATQAEEMPKSVLGRVVAVLWMFTAVIFVAYFTAQVTASLTVDQLQGSIKGPSDLPGKKVATTVGSTSAAYLRDQGAKVLEFPQIDDAYDALTKGDADAIVFDSPVLMYYASHGGQGKVRTVGEVFRKENYGIVFMPNSPYRKPIETALLSLKEDGTYQDLYDKWFSGK